MMTGPESSFDFPSFCFLSSGCVFRCTFPAIVRWGGGGVGGVRQGNLTFRGEFRKGERGWFGVSRGPSLGFSSLIGKHGPISHSLVFTCTLSSFRRIVSSRCYSPKHGNKHYCTKVPQNSGVSRASHPSKTLKRHTTSVIFT